MNEFDQKAQDWDKNPVNIERASAIAEVLKKEIPLRKSMTGFEYGCGTGLLGLNLASSFSSIIMADSSEGMLTTLAENISRNKAENLKPLQLDLEKAPAPEIRPDIIFTQMAMHHVQQIALVLEKFYSMLLPGGFICIADLYSEDGSFHGNDFTGHRGFDPEILKKQLETAGFKQVYYKPCYEMERQTDGAERNYPLFLMIGWKRTEISCNC